MKQGQLAQRMTEAGYRWHQATVAKVETQERQVQLGEAHALAAILGVTLQDIVGDPTEAAAAAKLSALVSQLQSAKRNLAGAHAAWWSARAQLSNAIAAGEEPYDPFSAPWDHKVEGELRAALNRLPADQRRRIIDLSEEDFEDLSTVAAHKSAPAEGTWWDDPDIEDPRTWGYFS